MGLPVMSWVLYLAGQEPLETRRVLAGAFVVGLPLVAWLHAVAISPPYPTLANLTYATGTKPETPADSNSAA